MKIVVQCTGCGAQLQAPPQAAGKKARCPHCRAINEVPAPPEPLIDLAELPPPPIVTPPAATTAAALPAQPPPVAALPSIKASSRMPWRMWLLLLTLIPLGLHILREGTDVGERIAQTLAAHPELTEKMDDMSIESLMMRLPDNRFQGAHLSYFTHIHWAYAALSGICFLGATFLLLEVGKAKPHHLVLSAVATATVGILLLTALQWLAAFSQGFYMTRGNIVVLVIFYLVKLIGFSYQCADNPEYGFWVSFFGFTLGVGLCEELVKAVPVIARVKSDDGEGWRAACAWGFASGVGFGTAEGILYSSQHYNGIADGMIYLVRFVSCVALHAIWSAAVGVTVWRKREQFDDRLDLFNWILLMLSITGVPMILHGLYDTLLKRDYPAWAGFVAIASVAWLFASIAFALRAENERIETQKTRLAAAQARQARAAAKFS